MQYKDYYKTLGVARDASQDEIKKAFRRLARKYHPDVSKEKDAEARFKEVNEAHEVLGDPEKRKAYDRLGANWKAGQEFRPPPGWEESFSAGGAGFGGAGGFSDFFDSLFGGGFAGAGRSGRTGFGGFRAKGRDLQASIQLDLEDLFRGAAKTVRLRDGRHVQVKIPAGVTEGQQIRLAGQGEPGVGGGPNGDLLLKLRLRPHPYFRLEGRDVTLDLPVAPWEAALGATVKVPTLGGPVELKIPAGSQSGNRLRLKGRGLPDAPPGDQYVVLQIVNPPADEPKARELFERMHSQLDFDPRAHLNR